VIFTIIGRLPRVEIMSGYAVIQELSTPRQRGLG
jgi:hypothetical protein